jgi:hypothetical protein
VSEKSTRKVPNYAVEPSTARNRPVFGRNCGVGLPIPLKSRII